MTELTARLGLYAYVDWQASRDEAALEAAARVLPLYRPDAAAAGDEPSREGDDTATDAADVGADDAEPEDGTDPDQRPDEERRYTVGWHRQLDAVIPEVDLVAGDQALQELADLDSPEPLDQARRLRAAWVLLQVVPDLDDDARGMLAPLVRAAIEEREGESAALDDDRVRAGAQALAALLRDPRFGEADTWSELVRTASTSSLISSQVAALAAVTCQEATVPVELANGDVDYAALVVTRISGFDVGVRTLAELRDALQPGNWPTCLTGFWCDMVSVTPANLRGGTRRWYQEKVGTCPPPWFQPYLVFATRDLVDGSGSKVGFEIQYDLCSPDDLVLLGRSEDDQDDRVRWDAGKIVVRVRQRPGAAPGHLEMDATTTKTILFGDALPSGAVALLACELGWADQTRMMMSGCLTP